MAMLAEKKKREKWCLNPRGNNWSNDQSKFGQRLLEKMGWSAGEGLGVNKQGPTEIVKVRKKDDSKGLGFKENGEEWLKTTSDFNELLDQLGNSLENSEDQTEIPTSLEGRSKKSKARVHYHKFTRGKDLSRYSKKDLASIIGPDIVKSKNAEDEVSPNYMSNQINRGSSEEYFNSKKNCNQHQLCEQDDYDKTGVHNHDEEIIPTNKKCKKNKKSKEHDESVLHRLEVSYNKIKAPKKIVNGTRKENTVDEFQGSLDNVTVKESKGRVDNDCNQQNVSIKKSKNEIYTNSGNLVNENSDRNVVDKENEEEFTMDLNQGLYSSSKKKKKSYSTEENNEYTQNQIEGDKNRSFRGVNHGNADVDTKYAPKIKKAKKGSSNEGDNEYSSIQIQQNICVDNEIKEGNASLSEESNISFIKKKNINDDETLVNKIEENADHIIKEQREEKKTKKSGKSNKNKASVIEDHYISLNIENNDRGLNEDSECLSKKKKKKYSISHNENSSIRIEENNFMDEESKRQVNVSVNKESEISSKKKKIRKSVNDDKNIMNEAEESANYEYKEVKKIIKSGKTDESKTNKFETDFVNSLDAEKKEKAFVGLNDDDSKLSAEKKKKKIYSNRVGHDNVLSQTVENNFLDKEIKMETKVGLNEDCAVSSKKEKNRKRINDKNNIREIEEIYDYVGKEHKKEKKKRKNSEIDVNITIKTSGEALNDVTVFESESIKERKKKKKKQSLEAEETFSHLEEPTSVEHLESKLRQSKLEKKFKKNKAPVEVNDNIIYSEKSEEQIQGSCGSKKKRKMDERLTEKESKTVQDNETAVVKTSQEFYETHLEVFKRRTRLRKINIPLKKAQDTKYETSDFMSLCTTNTKSESDVLSKQDETNTSQLNQTKIYGILNTHDCNLPKHVVAYEYRLLTDKLKEYNLVVPKLKIVVKDCKTISLAQHRKLKQLNKSRYLKTLLPKQDVKKIEKAVKQFGGELKPKIDMIDNLVEIEKKIAQLVKDLVEKSDIGKSSDKGIKSIIVLNSIQLETLENLSKGLLLLTSKANEPPARNNLEKKEKDDLAPDIANNTEESVAEKSGRQDAEEENTQFKNSLQTRIKEKCKVLMEQIKMLREGKMPLSSYVKVRDGVNIPEPSTKPAEKPANNQPEKNVFNAHQYSLRGRGRGRAGPKMRGSFMQPAFSLGHRAHNSIPYGGWGILKSYNESPGRGTFGFQGGFENNHESFEQRTLSFRGGFLGKNNSYGWGTYGFRGGFGYNNSIAHTFGFQRGFRVAPDSFRGRHSSEPRGRGRISKNNFDAKQYAEKCKELNTMPELSFKGVDLSKIIAGYAANKKNEDSNISNIKVPLDSVKLNKLHETNVVYKAHSELIKEKEAFKSTDKNKSVSLNLEKTSGALLDVIIEKEKT